MGGGHRLFLRPQKRDVEAVRRAYPSEAARADAALEAARQAWEAQHAQRAVAAAAAGAAAVAGAAAAGEGEEEEEDGWLGEEAGADEWEWEEEGEGDSWRCPAYAEYIDPAAEEDGYYYPWDEQDEADPAECGEQAEELGCWHEEAGGPEPAWLAAAGTAGAAGREPLLAPLCLRYFHELDAGGAPREQWVLTSRELFCSGIPPIASEQSLAELARQKGGPGTGVGGGGGRVTEGCCAAMPFRVEWAFTMP